MPQKKAAPKATRKAPARKTAVEPKRRTGTPSKKGPTKAQEFSLGLSASEVDAAIAEGGGIVAREDAVLYAAARKLLKARDEAK